MTALPGVTWFVGCGNMAGAMVEGWRTAGVDLSAAVAMRPSGRPVEGVRTVSSLAEAGPPPKLVVLGFKPQKLDEVAPALEPLLSHETVVVSILAGVEMASLWARFPNVRAIVRAMPNLPVAIRRGVVALYGEDVDDALRQQLANLFGVLGHAPWMTDEAGLAAVGSVAGAGPAYVARFVARFGQGRRPARPVRGDGQDRRARDGAWNGVDGGGERRDDGRARQARRQPQRHDRGGAGGARP